MNLLPGWPERLDSASAQALHGPQRLPALPKSPEFYAQQMRFIETPGALQAFVEFAQQRPIAWIGIDTEFRYERPPACLGKDRYAYDPRSIRPLLLSVALAEPFHDGTMTLYVAVIDLRRAQLLPVLRPLIELPVCFAGHHLKAELFCLWQLNLPEPRSIWDTMIHEQALVLGRNHRRYRTSRRSPAAEAAQVKQEVEEEETFSFSLLATCQRQGVPHRFGDHKSRLQESFLTHGVDQPFSREQIEYAAEDAIAAARLYPLQQMQATTHGIMQHLVNVEMTWVITNARMEWQGIRVDLVKRDQVLASAKQLESTLLERLSLQGLVNPNSHPQLKRFFASLGLLQHFREGDGYSFAKEHLAELKALHPAIRLVAEVRKAADIRSEKLLDPILIGTDGRVHPSLWQLGTHTGRQTSRWPNVLGLPALLRPVVVPDSGCGIGEADWSQVEVGVAAAVYGDDDLVQLYNSGDVYSAMAQLFFADQLSAEDRSLPSREFKRLFASLRRQMKTCTLGIIYGLTPRGLAGELNLPVPQAERLLKRFMGLFPKLQCALAAAAENGGLRGYASTMTGLRRHRAAAGRTNAWERNWLTNHPVQGSAAVVFKLAGNRLDRLYRRYDARLIVPLHDSFVFEAPLERLEEVSRLTEQVMCLVLQECFPQLEPRVEVDISHPECWNKEGRVDPLRRWINDCEQLLSRADNRQEGQKRSLTGGTSLEGSDA